MNRQRKVVITTTYNELGIIVATKAEELDLSAQPNLQLTCNQLATDMISRQAAIDAVTSLCDDCDSDYCGSCRVSYPGEKNCRNVLEDLPSVTPKPEPCKDAVSRQRLLTELKELVAAWKKYPVMAEQIKGVETAIGYVELIPSTQPEPSQVARDIATIIENEQDMRVMLSQPEIVRCKDCKHLFNKDDLGGKCWHFNGFQKVVSYDDFCSRAERRTDERTD